MILAGRTPSSLSFYAEDMVAPDDMGDALAQIVMQRFRDARESKSSGSVYQGKSTITLLDEADRAMAKEYSPAQKEVLAQAFGVCPTRFYGVASAKATMISDWKSELVASDPGALLQVVPTPDPRLPEASIKAIKATVKRELVERLVASGVGDPTMLLSVGNGRLHPTVKRFLDDRAPALREIEKARVITQATAAAKKLQIKMRDAIIEGDFREAYAGFNRSQFVYGLGILRFPYWQRRVVLADRQTPNEKPRRVQKLVPTFADVSPWNFFVVNDGRDVSSCTAVMEYREISKTSLIGLAKDSRYDSKAILDILDTYSMRSRTWMFPEMSSTESENGNPSTYWGPEELVAVIHHEGLLSGRDLQDHGLTGYDATAVYEARVEVCCGRAIRVEVKDPTDQLPRSYASAKFDSMGHGVWSCVGVPALLHDTEERINTLLRVWEGNADWSMRPPLQTNPEALKHPSQATQIRPGGQYQVNDMMGPGNMPDPIRAIRGPSAQYQIMWPIILQMIRQADSEVGVPDLASMDTFGRGSLGELSARVTAAVRRVRAAAFAEDRAMKPVWQVLYEHVMEENPELVEDADLDMNYLGVIGLLQKEQEQQAKIAAVGLVKQAVTDQMAPPEALQYAYHEALTGMGVPVDSLGMENPLIANAAANALAQGPVAAGGLGLAGAPKLDGRSGSISAVPSAIANPNGGSNALPPI